MCVRQLLISPVPLATSKPGAPGASGAGGLFLPCPTTFALAIRSPCTELKSQAELPSPRGGRDVGDTADTQSASFASTPWDGAVGGCDPKGSTLRRAAEPPGLPDLPGGRPSLTAANNKAF